MLYHTIRYATFIVVGAFYVVWLSVCLTVVCMVIWGSFQRFIVAPVAKLLRRKPEQPGSDDLESIVEALRHDKPGTKAKYIDRKTNTAYIIGNRGRKVCGRYSLKNKFKHKQKPIDRDFFKKGEQK